MTELFTLVNRPVAGQAQQTVNARELHAFFGNKMHFADWIKKRIVDYGFVENVDYVAWNWRRVWRWRKQAAILPIFCILEKMMF